MTPREKAALEAKVVSQQRVVDTSHAMWESEQRRLIREHAHFDSRGIKKELERVAGLFKAYKTELRKLTRLKGKLE